MTDDQRTDVLPPIVRVVGSRYHIDDLVSDISRQIVEAYNARRDAHPEGIVVELRVLERTG